MGEAGAAVVGSRGGAPVQGCILAFLRVGLSSRNQWWVRLCRVVRKAPCRLWAVPCPGSSCSTSPGVTTWSRGPSGVLGVPFARDPAARAACSGWRLVLLRCSLRALLPSLHVVL